MVNPHPHRDPEEGMAPSQTTAPSASLLTRNPRFWMSVVVLGSGARDSRPSAHLAVAQGEGTIRSGAYARRPGARRSRRRSSSRPRPAVPPAEGVPCCPLDTAEPLEFIHGDRHTIHFIECLATPDRSSRVSGRTSRRRTPTCALRSRVCTTGRAADPPTADPPRRRGSPVRRERLGVSTTG